MKLKERTLGHPVARATIINFKLTAALIALVMF